MSIEREINLKTVEHMASFFEKFQHLREEGDLTDFTIKVGNESINAHRFVLAASSEYFRAMLEHDTKENRQGFVDMKDVNMKSVRKAVDFIYTGKASVATEDIADLIHAACLMQLEVLFEGLSGLLADDITVESFHETKKFADIYSCKELANACNMFAFKHFEEIVAQDEFIDFDKDYVVFLIRSCDTEAAEVVKYKAFWKWINADAANRRMNFTEMMKCLILTELPASFRRHLVENEPMVYKFDECLHLILKSIFNTFGVNSKDVELASENSIAGFDFTSKSIQAYDIRAKTWNKVREVNACISFTIAKFGRNIYILRQDQRVFRLQYLNASAKWTEVAPMQSYHGYHPPVVIFKGQIYVIGAQDPGIFSEKYDPQSNEWSGLSFASQWTGRRLFALCASQDTIYCVGGCKIESTTFMSPRYHELMRCQAIRYAHTATRHTFTIPHHECIKLHDSNPFWVTSTPMNHARYDASAVHNEGTIYVAGGQGISSFITVCESYDIASDTWTGISTLPMPLCPARGLSVAGEIYFMGPHTFFKYNIEDDKWEVAGSAISDSFLNSGCFAI